MIYPFEIHEGSLGFANKHYPDLETLKRITLVNRNERTEIVRLYFTEGIPFAFLNNPVLFEKIRVWLGRHIDVNPKAVSITGSARIGYSLNPYKTPGKIFSNESDLDFIIVDNSLFGKLEEDFFACVKIFASSSDSKISTNRMLLENILEIERNIPKGFIDHWKIPNWRDLNTTNNLYSRLHHLLERLKITKDSPIPVKATVRVYKDWDSCVDRISFNLNSALK
ncbi:MAG: hypothetical protein V4565_14640 [Bacteroidota bacterium]